MSFPDKEKRQQCWEARDDLWNCMDKNENERELCKEFRAIYESTCPAQWVKHFDRKRNYLKFKEKIEKEGVNLLNTIESQSIPNQSIARKNRIYRQIVQV
ncbi:cytochrome c oxidase assembly factor 6 homolog [Artemia franciscana]|uniref:cytochrome c oxidase assembly factor 6 homolog n=1 Tax=Artemia franciscana TaxID=6661 RepID=UPI0032DAC0C3